MKYLDESINRYIKCPNTDRHRQTDTQTDGRPVYVGIILYIPLSIITGASGSIGSAAAVSLAKLGTKLALTGRDTTKLTSTAESCKKEADSPDHVSGID